VKKLCAQIDPRPWMLSTHLPRQMWEIARKTITAFDPRLDPEIYVIALPHETAGHPLISGTSVTCDIPMTTATIRARARRLEGDYWRHPDKHSLHKRGWGDEVAVRSECLRRTVQRIVDTRTASDARVQSCGEAAEFEKFDIVPVIELSRPAYDTYLKLKRLPRPYARMRRSFVDALVEVLLEAMSAEISSFGANPLLLNAMVSGPLRFPPTISQDPDDYLRAAGRWLMSMLLAGDSGWPTRGLFEHCDGVSSRPYEGRAAHGRMLLATHDNSHVDYCIQWEKPVSLADHRWVRKLLEMSSPQVGLVSDAVHVHGLGAERDYRTKYENVFSIDFRGHHRWIVFHAQHEIMRVVDGTPQAPRQQLDASKFKACVLDTMPSRSNDVDLIWGLVGTAVKQNHGTMLIIHADAEQEARRLANQSTLIAPRIMTPDVLERVSGIDGGVLIDPLGRCYAIGVILDGVATKRGDPSRGARYNSALRYVDSSTFSKTRRGSVTIARGCVVVVVSADGDVELVHAAPTSESDDSRGHKL
jgi:hypothetical protein